MSGATCYLSCPQPVLAVLLQTMSSGGRLADLEQSAALLVREVDRLTRENKDLAKLRQENLRLQERNVQLAAELSALTAERELREGREEREGYSDVSTGGCPGDSYPAVAASLDDIESDVNTDGEEVEQEVVETKKQEPDYLLQKLRKGGSRMEQIKRQLVVQRGAIVAALKVLAQSRAASSGSLTSTEGEEEEEEEEKDRTLVSMTATDSRSECKMCPMCEAMFPLHSEEEFEQHVMDHFSYDSDPDTLQYYPHHHAQSDIDTEIQTEHL